MSMTITVLLVLFFSNINCNLQNEYENQVATLMKLIYDGQYPLFYESDDNQDATLMDPQFFKSVEDSSKPKLTKFEKKQANSRVRLIKKKYFKL